MRLRTALAAALMCATAAAAAPTPRHEVSPSPQALALARAVRDGRSEAKGVQAQIAHLRGRLTALAAVEAAGERGDGDKRARLDSLNRKEEALTAELGRSQNATARLLGVLALYRRDPPPALLVHPASAKDAVRAQILARAMAPELQARKPRPGPEAGNPATACAVRSTPPARTCSPPKAPWLRRGRSWTG